MWGVIDEPRTLVVSGAVTGELFTPYIDERAYAVLPKQLWQLGSSASTLFLGYRSPVDNGGVDGQCGEFKPSLTGLANYTGHVLVYRWEMLESGPVIPDMTTLIGGVAPGETKTFNGFTISVSAVSACGARL